MNRQNKLPSPYGGGAGYNLAERRGDVKERLEGATVLFVRVMDG